MGRLRIFLLAWMISLFLPSNARANGLVSLPLAFIVFPLSVICSASLKIVMLKRLVSFSLAPPRSHVFFLVTIGESFLMLFTFIWGANISMHYVFSPFNWITMVFSSCIIFIFLAWPINFVLVTETRRPRWRKAILLGFIFPAFFWTLALLVYKGDFPPDYSGKLRFYTGQTHLREPKSAEDFVKRGSDNVSRGEYRSAISDFHRAIELNPNSAHIYYARAHAYKNDKQIDLAIDDLTRALEIDPNLEEARYWRALYRSEKGQYDQALDDLNKYIENRGTKIKPQYFRRDVIIQRAKIYVLQGRFDEAIVEIDHYLESHPRDGAAYLTRAEANYRKGNYEKSWEDVRRLQNFEYMILPEFLYDLRKASGK